METLHERLAHLRAETGLGLRSFAREVEDRTGYRVSHTTVSSYESGGTVPVGYALAVADAFGVSCEWLVTGTGSRRPTAVEAFFHRHPEPALALDAEDLTVVEANDAFQRHFGEAIGDGAGPGRLLFLLHPEDRDDAREAFRDADGSRVRVRVQSHDGYLPATVHPFEGQGTLFCALRDVGGAAQGDWDVTADLERAGP